MGFLDGMLGGFTERKYAVEAEERERAEKTSAREAQIFQALLSSPDPEIQAMATAGLLESAQPKKKKGGLRGWLGEMESSPIFGKMQALIQKPVQTDPGTMAEPPSTQYPALATPPPTLGQAPAGMAASSPIEPGAPAVPRPAPVQIPGKVGTPPTMGPRKVFSTPEETYAAQARGKAKGDVEGQVAGLVASGVPEAVARDTVQKSMLRAASGAAGQTYAEGNVIPDPDSPTGYSQELYLRADPSKKTRIPAQAPLTPETAGARAAAVTTARAGAAAAAPLNTNQRFQATTGLQDDWRKVQAPVREMERQYKLMETGLDRFNQGDKIGGSQAVLVTFQKILDPTSVVRESEYARSPQGLGLAARIEGYVQRLQEGGAGVPPQELAAMVETARQFLAGLSTWNDLERSRIESTAKEYGIDPSLITGTGAVSQPSAGVGTSPPGAPAAVPKAVKQGNQWMIQVP